MSPVASSLYRAEHGRIRTADGRLYSLDHARAMRRFYLEDASGLISRDADRFDALIAFDLQAARELQAAIRAAEDGRNAALAEPLRNR